MTGAAPPGFAFLPALPEIALLVSACTVLLVDLLLPETRRNWSYWLTQLGVLVTAWMSLYVFHADADAYVRQHVHRRCRWRTCSSSSVASPWR